MKNNLDNTIEKIKVRKRIGIITHLVTGYPTIAFSKKIARTLVKAGADIIEIQIPFSDPMADGPLIVKACQKSINNGTQIKDSFELAKFITTELKIPVVLMTYSNIVIHIGIERFCIACKKHGVSGVIVPDLPYDSDECKLLQKCAKEIEVHLIYVISPAVEDIRLKEIQKLASGFLYCTSRQGTTGTDKNFFQTISSYLRKIRKASPVPLAVGFGISSLEDVKLVGKYSEIIVVGSAIINIVNQHKTLESLSAITKFINEIKK
jgi:tryptophan synthase alpha subunit